MPPKVANIFKIRWIHISPITTDDLGYLEQHFKFHHLDLKDCQEGVQRPKIDIYKHYLFMILHFPIFDEQKRRVGIRSLNLFLGKDYLVTVTNDHDDDLGKYFNKMKMGVKRTFRYDPFKNNSSYILYKLLEILYHQSLPVINEIGSHLNEVEDEVYAHKNKEATANLAIVRRNIMNLRRVLEPQLKMIDKLVNMKAPYVADKMSAYFDDVHDYMENMWTALESYRDSLDGLYSTNESIVNQKTNEIMKTLTVISVALLPMTLVASIYGMNVQGLPFANHPIGLWMVFFILAAIVFGSIYYAKRKKII